MNRPPINSHITVMSVLGATVHGKLTVLMSLFLSS